MKKKIITIICIVCIVLLVTALVVFSYVRKSVPKNPEGTVGNTTGNLYNGGLFCEKDGVVYFANPYDGYALYSMNSDESDIKRLLGTSVSSINADSKFLYYYQNGSVSDSGLGSLLNATGVFRIQIDNLHNNVCLDRVLGKYVILADNDVYYTCGNDSSLKRVSTDGKTKETILPLDILPVSVQNSNFYYINNQENLHLMALDLRNGNTRQVLPDDVYMPTIEGVMVYGIDIHDNYSLISLNMVDGTKTLLDSDRTDLINVTDNFIYYQTSGDTPQLKRIRRDGSDMQVVAEGAYHFISSTSQFVYFTAFGSDTPVYKTPAYGPLNVTTFDAAALAATNAHTKK